MAEDTSWADQIGLVEQMACSVQEAEDLLQAAQDLLVTTQLDEEWARDDLQETVKYRIQAGELKRSMIIHKLRVARRRRKLANLKRTLGML